MAPPVWLPAQLFLQAVTKGIPGLRLVRRDGFFSAMAAPIDAYDYGAQGDVFALAGVYAERVAKADAFADGNKRTGRIAATTFLELNGVALLALQDALVEAIVGPRAAR